MRARAAEIPGIDPGSSVLLLNGVIRDARARAAEILGIDPGSSVLLLNGSTVTSSFSRPRARAPRTSRE